MDEGGIERRDVVQVWHQSVDRAHHVGVNPNASLVSPKEKVAHRVEESKLQKPSSPGEIGLWTHLDFGMPVQCLEGLGHRILKE
jgi:hypothetical protein